MQKNNVPEIFGIDFNVGGVERPLANTIKARYDAGVTNFKQDGTAVAIPVSFSEGEIKKAIDTAHCLNANGPAKEGVNTHQEMNRVVIPVLTPDRIEKKQNGRRFKEDGDESFTLTGQDRHGVAIGVNMSGNNLSEGDEAAHCLNANDQRKIFGARQERTMVGVPIKEATKQGYAVAHEGDSINLTMPDSKTRRGRVGGGRWRRPSTRAAIREYW